MPKKLQLQSSVILSIATELDKTELSKITGGAVSVSGIGTIKKSSRFEWTSEKITRVAERRRKGDNPLWDLIP